METNAEETRMKMHWRIVAAAVVLGPAAEGCSDAAVDPLHGIVVETTVDPAVIRPGETVAVRVVVTNTAVTSRTIPFNQCPLPFVIEDSRGIRVGPHSGPCSLMLVERTLSPLEQVVLTYSWNGTLVRADGARIPAPPGVYRIRGQLAHTGVQSAPAAVRVDPGP